MHSGVERFDGLEFLNYLWRRRAVIAVAAVTALTITGGVSALLPSRYTAKSTVLIEAPGGNDPRAATAVSPVYLESLKTYQLLASSDTLFSRALDDLQLRRQYPNASIESLKNRFLSFNKPANTSIIEISATMSDPRQAQALAEYLAEHTVQLSAQLDDESNQDVLREPQRILDAAAARVATAEKASSDFARTSAVESLSDELAAAEAVTKDVERDLAAARAEAAESLAREQVPAPADGQSTPNWAHIQTVGARARVQELEKQDAQWRGVMDAKNRELQNLLHTRDILNTELDQARTNRQTAQNRLSELRSSAALRGIQLRVLDPGIVPQRPSFPNIPLNLAVALLASLLASIGYLAVRFGYAKAVHSRADPVYSLR